MTQTNSNGKKSLLTNDDVCLYCEPQHTNDIYVIKANKGNIFFEHMKLKEKEYVFVITSDEAKEELKALKPFLTAEQKEKCEEIWSDF